VVLHLLVDHEEDKHDDAGRDGLGERGEHTDDRAQRRADQRDEVGQTDEQRDQRGERHVQDGQHAVCEQAADHADQQVAGDVTGHRLGAVLADPADPLGAPRRE
jgi:hypothetical protein